MNEEGQPFQLCPLEQQRTHDLETALSKAELDIAKNADEEENDDRMKLFRRHAPRIAEALWVYQYAGDKNEKVPSNVEEASSNAAGEAKKALIGRAQTFLQEWRLSLKVGDTIHCPDYIDEYEYNDESRGFIKLYAATIQKRSGSRSWVSLGDSSAHCKSMYQLDSEERAIFVKFIDYPDEQARWIVLGCDQPLSMNVVPLGSHEAAKRALGAVYPDYQSEDEEPEEAAGSSASAANNSKVASAAKSEEAFSNVAVPLFSGTKAKRKAPPKGKTSKQVTKRSTSAKKSAGSGGNLKKASPLSPDESPLVGTARKQVAEKHVVDRKRRRVVARRERKGIGADSTKKEGPVSTTMDVNGGNKADASSKSAADSLGQDPSTVSTETQSSDSKRKRENGETSSDVKPQSKPVPTGGKAKKAKSSRPNVLDFTWICTECNEAECDANPEADLLLCEGGCHRPFHYTCANLSSMPPSDEKWVCEDCQKGRHRCVLCEEYGTDNEEVYCCNKEDCGLFFHESCLSMQNVEIQLAESSTSSAAEDEDLDGEPSITSKPHFICPAHSCWACTEDYVPPEDEDEDDTADKKKKGKGRKKKTTKVSNSFAMKRDHILYVSLCTKCVCGRSPTSTGSL